MERTFITGLEFGPQESQICCFDEEHMDAVSVIYALSGSRTRFPSVLSYMPDTEKWSFGDEAVFFAKNNGAEFTKDVLKNCENGFATRLAGRTFSPGEIFARFVSLSLTAAKIKDPAAQIRVLTVTVPRITKELAAAAKEAFSIIGFDPGQAYLQDNSESFFCHTFYQKSEVYRSKVGLFVFEGPEHVSFKSLTFNPNHKPPVVTAFEDEGRGLAEDYGKRDRQFVDYIQKMLSDDDYSGIFIVGSAFDRKWARESISLICRGNRKVFTGDNLFAKGACYSSLEKCSEKKLKGILYLGGDLVQENIGMDMMINGTKEYYPLISAGGHWYEQDKTVDFLLDDEDRIIFRISRLGDGMRQKAAMELPGLPARPRRTTRIRLRIRYESARKCVIEAADLGFGELFRSSGLKWKETL